MAIDSLIKEAQGLTDVQIEALVQFVRAMKGQNEQQNTPRPIGYREDGTPYYRKAGAFKGKIWMSDDFDEPLEDFKEYM